jgi:diguanylate cyclase (GGDEF)-like protein
MAHAVIELRPAVQISIRKQLTYALGLVVALHAALILAFGPHAMAASYEPAWYLALSRLLTAAVPLLAGVAFLWRAGKLPAREQVSWRWLSLTLLLWSAGQIVETLIGSSAAASNLSVDGSDFLYITASFPLLLAISSTRETESIRAVFYLDSAQILLASLLAYVLLFGMHTAADQAASTMGRIYAAECSLLAVGTCVRLVSWSTLEERRRIRGLCAVVWIYLPIELGMDYASRRWNLHAGTLLDLLWSVPFVFAAWKALHMPIDQGAAARLNRPGRARMLVESLCPMLVTFGIFALAASIVGQHRLLALAAIFALLVVQSLHAGAVQLNYLTGQRQLLEREEALKDANSTLEQLSMLDPLTGVHNRRRFTAALEEAWRRALLAQSPVAVLMIDIDFFKGINDQHGHAYGDQCLTAVARALGQQTKRSNDLLARYGGEEFVLLLPGADTAGAMVVADRMHAEVSRLGVVNNISPFDQRMTISIGVGTGVPRPGVNPSVLVETADQALYQAKRLGRNRIGSKALD